ncbi:MAG TPA: hypothetical protein VGM88_00675 [Kofleriaceae bacterium]
MAACGGGGGGSPDSSGGSGSDAGHDTAHDTPVDVGFDANMVDDGTPTRQPCTSNFGSGLTEAFGRLDGYLVAIVPPGGGPCNADSDHVHLQIQMNGDIYDVAITASDTSTDDVHTTTIDNPLIGPAWSEGWHTGTLVDYVALGKHSTDIPLQTKEQITSAVTADLATVNHISVYGTGYGPDGAHLVHRNGSGHDGLLVTEPLSTPAHLRMFSFSDQTF